MLYKALLVSILKRLGSPPLLHCAQERSIIRSLCFLKRDAEEKKVRPLAEAVYSRQDLPRTFESRACCVHTAPHGFRKRERVFWPRRTFTRIRVVPSPEKFSDIRASRRSPSLQVMAKPERRIAPLSAFAIRVYARGREHPGFFKFPRGGEGGGGSHDTFDAIKTSFRYRPRLKHRS